VGTSASLGGAVHIAPPMTAKNAYVAPYAARLKRILAVPIFVAGRVNQPQDAELVIASGQADVCGMTRALICDPEMPNKARTGASDDIRACIACNQACIGHFHKGYPISCIQNPASGRELRFGRLPKPSLTKTVWVIGGGPAGMKAAAIAAERGHRVSLFEAEARLGGQALLAQLLPGRAEFGGIVTNLQHEVTKAGVTIHLRQRVDRAMIEAARPDVVIAATGAKPYWPEFPREDALQILDAWQVLRDEAPVGGSVVVIDWRADWIGIGIAERLARAGRSVRLAVSGIAAGENLPWYVRDDLAASLHTLGVQVLPYMRLYGCDKNSVYLQHIASGTATVLEPVDTLVLCTGHQSVVDLTATLEDLPIDLRIIGDGAAPRTAEEAVFEGLKVGAEI
jgi:NADPH-dependent 2,4-dienoyl-CoA reductase/sulfur reductase-like enzyme